MFCQYGMYGSDDDVDERSLPCIVSATVLSRATARFVVVFERTLLAVVRQMIFLDNVPTNPLGFNPFAVHQVVGVVFRAESYKLEERPFNALVRKKARKSFSGRWSRWGDPRAGLTHPSAPTVPDYRLNLPNRFGSGGGTEKNGKKRKRI